MQEYHVPCTHQWKFMLRPAMTSQSVSMPIVFATLHLAIHNPWMVSKSRLERTGLISLFSVLSFLNPIILVNAYEDAKEKTRKLAQSLDASFSQQKKKLKCIKSQWSTFIKIELGIIIKVDMKLDNI